MLTCGLRRRCAIALCPFLLAFLAPRAAAHGTDNMLSEVTCSTASCQMRAGTGGRTARSHARFGDGGSAQGTSHRAKTVKLLPQPHRVVPATVPANCGLLSLNGTCLEEQDPVRAERNSSPDEFARQVASQLSLLEPVIGMSPDATLPQIVGVPTWLWIDRAGWRSVSKTVAVPGVSVTATASPQRVVWSMGDGGGVTCRGSGTLYSSQFPADSRSPDCGYVYRRSSAGRPGEVFRVAATVVWDVVWRGGGRDGRISDLRTTSGVAVRVTEVQGVVVSGRGI